MIRTTTLVLVLIAFGAATIAAPPHAAAAPVSAAAPRDHGFIVGLQYQTSLIGAEDPPPGADPNALYFDEVGHGIALLFGYRFTPAFELLLSAGAARHKTTQEGVEANYGTGVLEARYIFVPDQRARPYLFGGLGGATIRVDTQGYESEIKGGVAVAGGGFAYSLTPHLVLDFTGRLDFINWDESRVTFRSPSGAETTLGSPVDDSGGAGKILLGLVWTF